MNYTNYTKVMEEAKKYVAEFKPSASSPSYLADIIRPILQNKKQEILLVILLDTKNTVIDIVTITIGLVNQSHVHAREVFRAAIVGNATKIALAHNHPSGDPTPSKADRTVTNDLVSAGKIINIEVVDHLIIGTKNKKRIHDYYSFRENEII